MDYETVSDFFKTEGNPNRLRIMRALTQGERCVGEVEDSMRVSRAHVSQHLTILKKQGIVACRTEKNMRCSYLERPEFVRSVLGLMEEEQRHGHE